MNQVTTDYSRDLDPHPDCPSCVFVSLEYLGDAEFLCPNCGRRYGLIELYNWCGKNCIVCRKRDQYLGTVLACFHVEATILTLAYPICGPCSFKGPDVVIENLQEIDEYHACANGGFTISPHPGSGREHVGGLIFFA